MRTTEQQLATDLAALSCSILAAEAANKSKRYIAPLYRKMFQIQDQLKNYRGHK